MRPRDLTGSALEVADARFVLLEKLAPQGRVVGRLAGVALIGWGGWMLMRGI